MKRWWPVALGLTACEGEARYAAWVSFDLKLLAFAFVAALLLTVSINALYWKKLTKAKRWLLGAVSFVLLLLLIVWLLNLFSPTPALRIESAFPIP